MPETSSFSLAAQAKSFLRSCHGLLLVAVELDGDLERANCTAWVHRVAEDQQALPFDST